MKQMPVLSVAVAALTAIVSIPRSNAQVAELPNVTATASEVVELWPNGAPDEPGDIGPEYVLTDRPRPFDQIAGVSVPTLSVFLPAVEKRTGTAMLVVPGGGLERLAIEHEGYEVAEWLAERGIAAFLLKYRVPPRDSEQRWKAGLQDAQRAMSIIRSRAKEWQVDEDAAGCIGFSAGGEINVMLSTFHHERQYAPVDGADAFSSRPDFNIPIYSGGIADVRSNAMREDIASRIDGSTPPMFIVHAFDDWALSSVILMNALKRANVVSELHIFGAGAHGFGFRESGLPLNDWRSLCLNWLAWQGYLDAPDVRDFAREFFHARATHGGVLPRFSDVVGSGNVETAFAAQRRFVRAIESNGAAVAGYKGAFTSDAAQSAYGIDRLLHGILFKQGRIDGTRTATITVDPERPILVETEIGYVMAVDIGTKVLIPRQAMTSAEAIVPVIELPANIGVLMNGTPNALDLTAANVGSNLYIVGRSIDPKSIPDADSLAVTLSRNGGLLHETTGADAKGGQARNLMNLINQIIEQGHVIHKGDIILSGALGGARPGEKGNYTADFGALGAIEFTID